MAAPTYSTDLSDIVTPNLAGGTTNWSALGGGPSALEAIADTYVEGDAAMSKAGFTSNTRGMIYNAGAQTIASGDAVFIWAKQANRNLIDTQALGGGQVLIGSGTGAYEQYYVDGNDIEGSAYLGWKNYAVDPTQTSSNTTGSPSGTLSYFGKLWKTLGSGNLKGNPNLIDAIRHGRELQCVDGDLANGYATFDGAASFDSDITRAWGLLTPATGSYQFHGAFVMGTSTTAVDFRDSNRNIVVLNDEFVASTFNEFEIRNASSNVEWTNINIQHLGTTSPSTLTLNVGTFTGTTCRFDRCGSTTFASTSSCTSSTWKECGVINANGATLNGSTVTEANVAANASALIWDTATDPDGFLDDMFFTMGSTATHAIEFGTTSPTSITLRGIDFSGYSATNNANDSTFYVKRTSGTVTINLDGCTGNFGYRTDGATVNVVNNPVTIQVTCVDSTGAVVSGVRVLVETAGAGPYPFNDSVTITQSAGTATVSHTSHGLATNDYVVISGANEVNYNGVKQITVTGTNSYTYSIDSGTASPATGTIVSSYAPISAVTDGTGIVSTSKVFGSNQAVTGVARKGTSSPRYKTAPISGTISSTAGLAQSAVMISDE